MNLHSEQEGYPMMDIPYEGRNGYYNSLERSQMKKEDRNFFPVVRQEIHKGTQKIHLKSLRM